MRQPDAPQTLAVERHAMGVDLAAHRPQILQRRLAQRQHPGSIGRWPPQSPSQPMRLPRRSASSGCANCAGSPVATRARGGHGRPAPTASTPRRAGCDPSAFVGQLRGTLPAPGRRAQPPRAGNRKRCRSPPDCAASRQSRCRRPPAACAPPMPRPPAAAAAGAARQVIGIAGDAVDLVVVCEPRPNSGTLLRPMKIAPAARMRSAMMESCAVT